MHARVRITRAALAVALAGAHAATAQAQAPPAPGDMLAPDSVLHAPGAVAPGGRLTLSLEGLALPARIEQRRGDAWVRRTVPITEPRQEVGLTAPSKPGRLELRARGADGLVTAPRRVRVRPLLIAAVGDVNFGDGPGTQIDGHGPRWPWASVGHRLRAADLAVANLECAVSLRGTPQEKTYVFRGRPASLRAAATAGGLDAVTLANNHSGDYGRGALLDTLRYARGAGLVPFGAGASETSAYRPAVVERLGLKVAFVGFSDILPFEFRAVGRTPGSAWAFPGRVAQSVRAARRQADVVVAYFHWGIERDTVENARQRGLARIAREAGATIVLGAHPHVLQPIRRLPGRLIAYSLGNFVFGASSPGTATTGILEVQVAARRVLSSRLIGARIAGSRPILRG